MNDVVLHEPRTITRLVYQMAIAAAVSDGARIDLLRALQWYELKWQAQARTASTPASDDDPPGVNRQP